MFSSFSDASKIKKSTARITNTRDQKHKKTKFGTYASNSRDFPNFVSQGAFAKGGRTRIVTCIFDANASRLKPDVTSLFVNT